MNIKRPIFLVPFFIVLLLLVRIVGDIDRDIRPDDRFQVVGVIDGDTVELPGGEQLRLLGIDCPERGEPFYDSATALTSALVMGKTVRVMFSLRRRDAYGRMLGYLFVDTLLVNEVLVRRGLANVYVFPDEIDDDSPGRRLQTAQAEALSEKIGIWSIPRTPEPYYLAATGSLRFHRPDCKAVRSRPRSELIRFETREEALTQGYTPCRNCRP
ncbi:MAG: thermonuclease family protein [candidate division Zixibacteria bacterium]|nr:thermonuclease family protein [candidate division Zixibacteria bacterium]